MTTGSGDEFVAQALFRLRQKLLDLTLRNRLLNYKESAAKTVTIRDELPDIIFSKLLEGAQLSFSAVAPDEVGRASDESADEADAADLPIARGGPEHNDDDLQTIHTLEVLDRKLLSLYRDHRTVIDETGGNDLHLIIGLLEYLDRADAETTSRAPLVLIPVHLVSATGRGRGGRRTFKLRYDDEGIEKNHSLAEKLRQDFGIDLPDWVEGTKPDGYVALVEQAIHEKRAQGWKVLRRMSLGLVSFAKMAMWRDLDHRRWPESRSILGHAMVRTLLGGAEVEGAGPGKVDGEHWVDHEDAAKAAPEFRLITDADVSQYSAIVDAMACKSGLVIQGPPGTGKSQTITNLIATLLADGKRVLFVAEKLAALTVVYDRLTTAGLDPFCLQLHGQRSNKKEIAADLGQRLALRGTSVQEVQQKRAELVRHKRALLQCSRALRVRLGPAQIPLHDAIWQVEVLRRRLPGDADAMAQSLESVGPDAPSLDQFSELKETLQAFGIQWAAVPAEARRAYDGLQPTLYREALRDAATRCFGGMLAATEQARSTIAARGLAEATGALGIRALFNIGKAAGNSVESMPIGVSSGFLSRVVENGKLAELGSLLARVASFVAAVKELDRAFDYRGTGSAVKVGEAKPLVTAAIKSWCLPGTTARDLPSIAGRYRAAIEALATLPSVMAPVVKLTSSAVRTLADCATCADEAEGLAKGHDSLMLYARASLARESARAHLSSALSRKDEIEKEAAELGQTFHRIDAIDAERLAACVEVFEFRRGLLSVFYKDYREATRYLRTFIAPGSKLSRAPAFLEQLRKLVAHARSRTSFSVDEHCVAIFGQLFKGLDTDWGALRACLETASRLKARCGAESASQILDHWEGHVEGMKGAAVAIRQRVGLVNALFESFGDRHALSSRPLDEVQRALAAAPSDLDACHEQIGAGWLNTDLNLKGVLDAFAAFERTRAEELLIAEHPLTAPVLGKEWVGAGTRCDLLRAGLTWIERTLTATLVPVPVLALLMNPEAGLATTRLEQLRQAGAAFQVAVAHYFAGLKQLGTYDPARILAADDSLGSLEALGQLRCGQLDHLALYARWAVSQSQLVDAGLGGVTSLAVTGKLPPESCSDLYEFTLHERLVRKAVETEPVLRDFSAATYESLRERFAATDRDVLRLNSSEIRRELLALLPEPGIGHGPVSQWTGKRLIENEAGKTTKHIEVRQLVGRAGNALRTLKPCFLMSPISVARHLDPKLDCFDVVVFDEASQIRPEDAMGAIARADKVIVVGDPKQLPPTDFYQRTTEDDDEEQASVASDAESILDVSLKQMAYRVLRFHYRSHHERLIQFSNEQFYDKDLIVVPSPARNRRDAGVFSTFIEHPTYHRGRNRGEAEVVVANIIRHYRQYPDLSLGVAAFNLKQAEEIQTLLDKDRRTNPEVDELIRRAEEAKEKLFIKNLENVQGDERDVIFISTTYGPEKAGLKPALRFGPISSELGWRRLNVIVTRAKHRVEVFTSLRPSDIPIGDATQRGTRALRQYLEYASGLPVTEHFMPSGGEPNAFESSVMEIVQAHGYEAVPQVGVAGFFIDIGVVHPEHPGMYMLGVECDGARYHSAKAVRDRDRLRQEILETNKGWRIHRIWGPSWYHTRSSEIDRLRLALESARRVFDQSHRPVADTVVISQVAPVSQNEIATERRELGVQLREALHLYRDRNIGEGLESSPACILNRNLVAVLVEKRPQTRDEWLQFIPETIRLGLDRNQAAQHLDGILDLVQSYTL